MAGRYDAAYLKLKRHVAFLTLHKSIASVNLQYMNSSKVRDWITKERWSAAQIARKLGISPSTMSRILARKSEPDYPLLVALSQMMGCEVSDIYPTKKALAESARRAAL